MTPPAALVESVPGREASTQNAGTTEAGIVAGLVRTGSSAPPSTVSERSVVGTGKVKAPVPPLRKAPWPLKAVTVKAAAPVSAAALCRSARETWSSVVGLPVATRRPLPVKAVTVSGAWPLLKVTVPPSASVSIVKAPAGTFSVPVPLTRSTRLERPRVTTCAPDRVMTGA